MSEYKRLSKILQPLFLDRAERGCPKGIDFGHIECRDHDDAQVPDNGEAWRRIEYSAGTGLCLAPNIDGDINV